MHLSDQFLSWSSTTEGGELGENDALFRAYDIWRHARDRIAQDPSDLDRVDAISALRRAVNHRLKSLRTMYNFDCLPSALGKKQTLERLQEFGIVRSAIIKDLLDVRNLLEHEDSDPPDNERCRRYVDVVWYFLKSTDKLVDVRNDSVCFEHEDGKQSVQVCLDYEDGWRVGVSAQVLADQVVEAGAADAIALEGFEQKKIRGGKGFVQVSGSAKLQGERLLALARGCFAAVGYWHDDA